MFTIFEHPESRSSNKDTATLVYGATGTTDDGFVRSAVLQYAPLWHQIPEGTLFRNDVQLDNQGFDVWRASVKYTKFNPQIRTHVNTSGGLLRMKVSEETIRRYPEDATDFKGLIGVDENGVPEGQDVVIPALRFSVTVKHATGLMTMTRAKNLARATASVNTDTWSTFGPGEALFMGLDTDLGTLTEVDSTYEFIASENRNDISIGDIADDIAKKGHELLWVTFEDAVDDGKAAKKPLAVYVERVYKQRNFSQTFGFEAS